MRGRDVVAEYVSLALRLGELLPGAVQVYGVPAEPKGGSAAAVVRAAGSLIEALAVADLDEQRSRFLRSQLIAVEWTARRLAGQAVPYAAEVAATRETAIEMGSPEVYRAAHRDLAQLLPGRGPLERRLGEHRARTEVAPDRLEPVLRRLTPALRERTRSLVELPGAERVELRVVDDAPWGALHRYVGGFASRITVNAGVRHRAPALVRLMAHEAYPGHHVERCRKEAGLVAQGCDEHRVVLTCTPQSLVAEGAADLGAELVPGVADELPGVVPGFDVALAAQVDAVCAVLARVRQDAALLVHEQRASDATVVAYLRRWALVDEARARRMLRFLRHPLWRTYPTTYVEGGPLVQRWWERQAGPARFRRLLDEPVTPAALRAEQAGPAPGESASQGGTVAPAATGGSCQAMNGSTSCELSGPVADSSRFCC